MERNTVSTASPTAEEILVKEEGNEEEPAAPRGERDAIERRRLIRQLVADWSPVAAAIVLLVVQHHS